MGDGNSLSNSGNSLRLVTDPCVLCVVTTRDSGVLAGGILPVNSMSLGENVVYSLPNIMFKITAQCVNATNAVNKSSVKITLNNQIKSLKVSRIRRRL